MNGRILAILALSSLVGLSGCVSGNTHTFNYVPTLRTEAGVGKVVVLFAVEDQRPYVLAGHELPSFVGEQRNGYGMPFNVTTSDQRPFVQVVQETVQRDLEAAGFRVKLSEDKGTNVASSLNVAKSDHAMIVMMREFKSDTYTNINFDYDFEVIVFDSTGHELVRDRIAGEEEVAGSFMNPPKAAKQKVPDLFYTKIHALITGNPKVMKALTD